MANRLSVAEEEIIFSGDTRADLEQVFDGGLLSEEGVDEGNFFSGSGGLAKVAEEGQDRVESVEVLVITILPLDSFSQFGKEDQIKNDGSGQKGVFTDVVDGPSLLATEEDFGDVFINSLLGVTSAGDVLDDDFVVGMFALTQDAGVGGKDIISARALGDLLGLEGVFLAQVLTVVVTKMVV